MQYALINGVAREAKPGDRGICKCCNSEMIAKCGQFKIHHWAHKSLGHCDKWWEQETEWHREWKNRFPSVWHEVILEDLKSKEKHIADVRSDSGLVVEFQHSPIQPAEVNAREQFYGDMVWIVDGCRNFNAIHFDLGVTGCCWNSPVAHVIHWFSTSKMFAFWCQATKPVFFDFGKDVCWRLVMYNPVIKKGVVGPIDKLDLIQRIMSGTRVMPIVDSSLAGYEPTSDATQIFDVSLYSGLLQESARRSQGRLSASRSRRTQEEQSLRLFEDELRTEQS